MLTKAAQFKLNVIKIILEHIPWINSGGCGIAAYVLYHVAKQIAPEADVKIMYMYRCEYDYDSNKSIIENNDLDGVHAPCHCFTMVDGIRYDTSRVFSRYDANIIQVQENFLVQSLLSSNWNPMFNRNHCRKIEIVTKLNLSQFYNDSIYARN